MASFETYHNSYRRGGVRGEDYIESYCDAVQWFLNTFATDEVLSEAFRKVNQMRQNKTETESEFANRLRDETLRCGDIFDEGNLTQMFIDGLNQSIRPLVHRTASRDPMSHSWPLREMLRASEMRNEPRSLVQVLRLRDLLLSQSTPNHVQVAYPLPYQECSRLSHRDWCRTELGPREFPSTKLEEV